MPTDKALPLLGMVLVTHGRLAEEMVTAMEHVVGPQRAIATVCIGPNDNMEMRRKEIAEAIRKVDEGRGVIMLTDLFGHAVEPRDQPARTGADRGDRGGQPADADPARKRAQGDGPALGGDRGEGSRPEIYLRRVGNAGSGAMSEASETVEITNQRGLHARASAKFVTFVSRLPETVTVEVEKGGSRVNGTSIMGLMMLGAAKGDSITIHTSGDGADTALLKLVGLVKDSFGED